MLRGDPGRRRGPGDRRLEYVGALGPRRPAGGDSRGARPAAGDDEAPRPPPRRGDRHPVRRRPDHPRRADPGGRGAPGRHRHRDRLGRPGRRRTPSPTAGQVPWRVGSRTPTARPSRAGWPPSRTEPGRREAECRTPRSSSTRTKPISIATRCPAPRSASSRSRRAMPAAPGPSPRRWSTCSPGAAGRPRAWSWRPMRRDGAARSRRAWKAPRAPWSIVTSAVEPPSDAHLDPLLAAIDHCDHVVGRRRASLPARVLRRLAGPGLAARVRRPGARRPFADPGPSPREAGGDPAPVDLGVPRRRDPGQGHLLRPAHRRGRHPPAGRPPSRTILVRFRRGLPPPGPGPPPGVSSSGRSARRRRR